MQVSIIATYTDAVAYVQERYGKHYLIQHHCSSFDLNHKFTLTPKQHLSANSKTGKVSATYAKDGAK
jgi:hypothetical protein